MTDETVGTAETQPADDIRSSLAAAFAEHESAEAAPEQGKLALEPEAGDKKDVPRHPDGKFAKKETQDDAADVADGADKGAGAAPEEKSAAAPDRPVEGEDGKEQKEAEDKFASFLKPWKAADQEMFRNLDPTAQDFLARRYKEMEGDYTKKLQANSRLRNEYEPVDKIFEPHRGVMQQKGFTPHSLIQAWANVETKLNSGPDQAAEVLAGLVRGYNIPTAKVAALLGIKAPAAQTTAAGEATPENPQPAALPPEIMARLQELDQIKQAVTGLAAERQQARTAAIASQQERAQNEIDSFKGAKDKDGALIRPHFDDVEGDMLALANAAIAAKQPVPSLSELYEKAVWANPATRERLLTAQSQAAEAKRIAQDKQKAAAAQKAAKSVTGAPGSGQATSRTQPERSLREELEANAADSFAA